MPEGRKGKTHLNEVEQLDDDGRDASEKPWSALSLHDFLQPFYFEERPPLLAHVGCDSARVQGLDGREEQGRHFARRVRWTGGGDEGGDVGFEGARVRGEVFVRCKLGRVDKDGDDRVVAFR